MKDRIWIIKFVLAGILLGVGLFMAFSEDVVYLMTGVILVIFALFRVFPLLKTLKHEVSRTIHLLEVLITAILGGVLIFASLQMGSDGGNTSLWELIYRFGLGFVFYARGVIYFMSTVFFNEKTKVLEFIIHLASLSIGTSIVFSSQFDASLIGIFFLIISVIGAGILSVDGYGGYKKYRQIITQDEKQKDKKLEKIKEKQQDVPLEDPKDERPYVN
jgi:hypothetical protein